MVEKRLPQLHNQLPHPLDAEGAPRASPSRSRIPTITMRRLGLKLTPRKNVARGRGTGQAAPQVPQLPQAPLPRLPPPPHPQQLL
jgi:hypothetical protein